MFKWARVGVLVVGALVLASLIRNLFQPGAADVVTADSRAILAATKPFKAAMLRRVVQESLYIRRARQWEHDASLEAIQLRSLATQLERAATAHDTIRVQDSLIAAGRWVLTQTQARCANLDSAYTSCGELRALMQVRMDTLESALARQIGVSTCKVLFIPCLGRVQSFEVGLLLGAASGYILTR